MFQHEPKILKSEKSRMTLESLLLDLEEEGLFIFPTDETMQYLDFIPKDDYIVGRAVQNMCSVAQKSDMKMSPFNSELENNRVSFLANEKTLICDDEKFYVIEVSSCLKLSTKIFNRINIFRQTHL